MRGERTQPFQRFSATHYSRPFLGRRNFPSKCARSLRLLTSAATLCIVTRNRNPLRKKSRFTKSRGRMKGARDSQAVGIGGFPLRSQVGTNCEISPAWLDEIHQAEK